MNHQPMDNPQLHFDGDRLVPTDVVASGSLSILSDGERFLLIPLVSTNDSTRSESPSKPDWSPCDGYDLLRCLVPQNPGSYLSLKDGFSSLEDSSTKKTPAHARLRIRPTVGLNLRATPSTVLSGTKGAGLFLQPLRL
ncbi:hypothetical protein PRIPAC_74429 [Pristionchus pacificus]|uniref:Uncharacterized protein n=1 Tax=Pristionchus pacificus TaxID=54126 RepID=A0A2A6BEI2_PRIPA|nr:hypothetical protein PRIPAC_74429 [Pristionchus pacificus]|eukprot:PDM64287.1 hypothetical protein PRIPAC_52543 [Pristionchus pacificus]